MPIGVYPRKSADERFDRMVDRSGECHLWTGPLASTGYANFWLDRRYIGAHVYAWMRVHGPLPDGQVMRHKCRNRSCVRLDHLETGTKGDNNRDRARDGTQARGPAHHLAKLTEDNIREAKELRALGNSYVSIGRKYGVIGETIRKAIGAPRRHSLLTEENIQEAITLSEMGVPWTVIARKYGVDGTTVARAVHGRTRTSSIISSTGSSG